MPEWLPGGAVAVAVQLAVSLVAILAVAWLAARMRLGGDERIRDEARARQLANDAVEGFEPVDVVLDRAGIGALLRDGEGRVMLLRRHGAHFAARMLDHTLNARLDRHLLTLSSAERSFGTITLDLGAQAQVWASSFRRLGVH